MGSVDPYDAFAESLANDLAKPGGVTAPTQPPRALAPSGPAGVPDLATTARDQALQQYLAAQSMNPLQKFFYGNRQENQAKRTLGILHPIVEDQRKADLAKMTLGKDLRAQQLEQKKIVGSFLDRLDSYGTKYEGLSEDQQKAFAPMLSLMFTESAKQAGLEVPEHVITAALTSKSFRESARQVFVQDPIYTPEDHQRIMQRAGTAKTTSELETILKDEQKAGHDRALTLIDTMLPKEAIQRGWSKDKPIPYMTAVQMVAQDYPTYAKSQAFQSALRAFPEDRLAAFGIQAPKATLAGQVKGAEVAAEGPKLDTNITDILAGQGLTRSTASAQQIEAARIQARTEEKNKAIDAAKAIGENAAALPQRTPPEHLKRIEDTSMAQFQVGEMGKLVPKVRLDKLLGGLNPWINQASQTGIVGPVPIPDALTRDFSPDEHRFLALVKDYADSVLRLRSGAQINEQEMKRMLWFLTDTSVKPEVFKSRLQLQSDLLNKKVEIMNNALKQGGYRATGDLTPQSSTPTAPAAAPKVKSFKVLP